MDETAILLSDNAAAAMLGISRATFWRRVNDDTMPRPLKLGGATRWRRDELMAAVDALSAERSKPEAALAVRRADNADGFQHIAGPANRVAEQVVNAVIERAERAGDLAMAERLRRCWQESLKERIGAT